MTVCIAAITFDGYIVTASDTMTTGATCSADMSAVKAEPFARDWVAMISADDITQCAPVIQRAAKYFTGRANTQEVARQCFMRAYQRHITETAEDQVLSRFGITMEEFLRTGKRRFTERMFDTLCGDIRSVRAACDFLIFGFDGGGRPHIFTVGDSVGNGVWNKPGFCAIGSGRWAAEGMLFHFGQSVDKGLHETIFNVCAAKFAAEKTAGIGHHTYLFAKRPGSQSFAYTFGLVEEIRDAWESSGAPRVPVGPIDSISRYNMACH